MDEDDADRLLIAVGEAISNAYLHGTPDATQGRIQVLWKSADDQVTITVKDSGMGARDASRPSGSRGMLARGTELMRAGADEFAFSHHCGSEVTLVKRLRLES